MVVGGVTDFVWGVDAEGKPLESIATPLSLSKRQYRAGEAVASGPTGGLNAHVRRTRSQ